MQNVRNRHGRRLTTGALATVLAVGLAACGSGDDDGGAASGDNAEVVAAAQAVVDEHVTISSIGPTTPIEGEIPANQDILYVNCGQPACTNQGVALKAAVEELGWNYDEIQAQPTPEAIQAAFDEALRRAPDMVASSGFGKDLYPRQLEALNDAGITVMSSTGTEESGEGGIAYEPLGPKGASAGTAALANKTIVDIGGEGEIGSVLLGGYPIVQDYTASYEEEIKAQCPNCTIKQLELQPTDLGGDAASKIANFMRANPNMKAIFYSYDLMGVGVPAAAQGAGVTEVPLSYSWAPDGPGLQALQTGERAASAFYPHNEIGWMLADGFARLLTGADTADLGPTAPIQIIGKDLDNLPAEIEPYPTSVADYQEQFRALWGL